MRRLYYALCINAEWMYFESKPPKSSQCPPRPLQERAARTLHCWETRDEAMAVHMCMGVVEWKWPGSWMYMLSHSTFLHSMRALTEESKTPASTPPLGSASCNLVIVLSARVYKISWYLSVENPKLHKSNLKFLGNGTVFIIPIRAFATLSLVIASQLRR